MLFPFSIEGAALIWLEKEPPRSIVTWEDLVSKFINQFFPPSKTTNLRNEITNFQQRFDESFCEAWERFKDLFRACPHHAAGGNLLTKTPKDALTLIENESKVRTSQKRPVVSKVSTNTSTLGLSPDVAALTDAVKALLLKNTTPPPASVKAVEESCVTYGGPHPYYQCLATDSNASGSGSGPLPSNTVTNTKVVEREPEVTKDPVKPCTEKVQPPNVQPQAPTSEPVISPKPKPYLPYPSRLNNQKLRERDDHQMMKFLQIFRRLHFDLSFTDALLYMPKFASTFKNLLAIKENYVKLANTTGE
ncbi:reverse transcriptase domain-containing protein [Tanacetum coccineum]